jgi:queuine tRNA-ribosyltransferase
MVWRQVELCREASAKAEDVIHTECYGGLQHPVRYIDRDPSLRFGVSSSMPFSFQIENTSGAARLGRMQTAHGVVETPVFMPVGTLATVKGVPQHVLEELGAQIILANTYHTYLRPGTKAVRELGGLHRFMSWNRAILTDSGGYQVFSLNELRKVTEEGVRFRSHLDGSSHFFSPESAMEAQIALGADIIMAFDECTEYPAERGRAQKSMEMTARWARRSKDAFEAKKGEVPWGRQQLAPSTEHRVADDRGSANIGDADSEVSTGIPPLRQAQGRDDKSTATPNVQLVGETQALFGIVQGGMYADLRVESAQRSVEIDFPGYAIGGLSVGEPRNLTREVIEATLPHLPADKPRYVMGVGYPEEIVEYAAMGVDMMDCVLPTRAARHGLLFTTEGRMNIKNARYALDQNPPDPKCGCWVCGRYTRAYLRHLFTTGESLAGLLNSAHNLFHYLDTMRRVRHAIRLGELSGMLQEARSLSAARDHGPELQ